MYKVYRGLLNGAWALVSWETSPETPELACLYPELPRSLAGRVLVALGFQPTSPNHHICLKKLPAQVPYQICTLQPRPLGKVLESSEVAHPSCPWGFRPSPHEA